MVKIIFGLLALALGLWGLSVWWWSVVEMLRGLVSLLLIIIGFVALGAGITRIRDAGHQDEVGVDEETGGKTAFRDE
ncbi:MAG: hypothetical protein HQL84_02005 [Magnetococcales bacterium]|nr:hypothetical protein [Magnetococcales bacterium]MBF0148800.1 hypothetical protein [Magnetococcales bacterium]MBF0173400.1 hypothetical protein [Magnetococcales bacterium]MBF0346475.1 hypothetical protein [Magnetococcales bacterium]MBF0629865.1 hypothetical protein [Magnetococcales bacterium]